jgi:hypothetical protein
MEYLLNLATVWMVWHNCCVCTAKSSKIMYPPSKNFERTQTEKRRRIEQSDIAHKMY